MKFLMAVMAIFALSNLSAQDWTNKNRALPDILREIPVSIYIQHDPNPCYPELASTDEEYKYVWKHSTSVSSPNQELKVIKAGSFIWYNEEGWKKNVEYNRKTFAKRFNCPKGVLATGKKFVFEKNYRFGNNLYGGDALWYVIAEDNDGNIYKGMALIETESKLKN